VDFAGFPTSEDLIKNKVASSSDNEVSISSEWLWTSSTNFIDDLSFTFSGVDDTLVDGDENITITIGPIYSNDAHLLSSLSRTTWIVNRDNDISVSWTSGFISENGYVSNISFQIPASTENVVTLTHTQVTISYDSQKDVEVSYPSDGRLTWSTDIEILFNLSIGVSEDVMFSMVDDLFDDGDGSCLMNISVDAYYSSHAWESVEDDVDGTCS